MRLQRWLKQSWPYYVLGAICLLSVINWYRPGLLIYFWDQTFPLDPWHSLASLFSVWHPEYEFGRADTTAIAFIPYFFTLAILRTLTGSLVAAQAILYGGLFTTAGVGTYILMRELAGTHPNAPRSQTAWLIGAVIYLFNPFTLFFIWRIVNTTVFLYAFLPILLVSIIRRIQSRSATSLLWIILCSIMMAPGLSNPAFVPVVGLIMVIAATLVRVPTREKAGRFVGVMLLMVALSSYWIIPVAFGVSRVGQSGSFGGVYTALAANSTNLGVLNSIRLLGASPITEEFNGERDTSWAEQYNTQAHPYRNLIPFIPLVLGILAIMYGDRRLRYATAVTLLGIILFTFLAKGLAPPFGNVFGLAFEKLPVFRMYRDPFSKFGFGLLLFTALLTTYSCLSIISKYQKYRRALVAASLGLIPVFIGYGWPIFDGSVYRDSGQVRPAARVDIPADYSVVANKIASSGPGSRTLSFPKQQLPLMSELWPHGYVGFDPLRTLSGQSIISTTTSSPSDQDLIDNLYRYTAASVDPAPALKSVGIEWLLVRKKNNPAVSSNALDASYWANKFKTLQSLESVYTGEFLELYRVKNYQPYPMLVATQELPPTSSQTSLEVANRFYTNIDFSNVPKTNIQQVPINGGALRYDVGSKEIKITEEQGFAILMQPANTGEEFGSVTNITNFAAQGHRYAGLTARTSPNAKIVVGFSRYENGNYLVGSYAAAINPPTGATDLAYSTNEPYQLVFDLGQLNFIPNHISINVVSKTDDDESRVEIHDLSLFNSSPQFAEVGTDKLELQFGNGKIVHDIQLPVLNAADSAKYKYVAIDVQTASHTSFTVASSEKINFKYITGNVLTPQYDPGLAVTENGTYSVPTWKTVYFPLDDRQRRNFLHINAYNDGLAPSSVMIRNVRLTDYSAGALDLLERLGGQPNQQAVAYTSNPAAPQPERITPSKVRARVAPGKIVYLLSNLQGNTVIAAGTGYDDAWVMNAKSNILIPHLKLNDFANGWYIDVDKLCKQQNLCHANPDGTYDMELVAEFTPQRWFYVGLIISGLTLAGCLGYLGLTGWRHWRRRRGSGATRPKSQGGASPRASKPARRIVRL